MKRLTRLAALGVIALSFAALACDNAKAGATTETEATPLPPIKVDLPPPPAFTPPSIPEKYPDGAYSIFGARKQIEKLTGSPITVKGFVKEVYLCPECPKGQECKACQQPHFWLTDEKDGKIEKAMMVVDYPTKKPLVEKPPVFTVGARYTVKGNFQRASITGFNASDGLLTHQETKDESGQTIVEGNVNVAFDVKGTAAGQGDKMRAKVEGTDKPKGGALPKKRGKK